MDDWVTPFGMIAFRYTPPLDFFQNFIGNRGIALILVFAIPKQALAQEKTAFFPAAVKIF